MIIVFMFIYIVIRTYLHTVFVIYTSPKLTANAPENLGWLSNLVISKLGICPFFRGELSAMLVSGRVRWYTNFCEDSFPRGHDLGVARWRCRYMKKPGLDSFLGSENGGYLIPIRHQLNATAIFIISWLMEWIFGESKAVLCSQSYVFWYISVFLCQIVTRWCCNWCKMLTFLVKISVGVFGIHHLTYTFGELI